MQVQVLADHPAVRVEVLETAAFRARETRVTPRQEPRSPSGLHRGVVHHEEEEGPVREAEGADALVIAVVVGSG